MSTDGVRTATPADLASAVETFALAFADDPVWGFWTFPGVADRAERLRKFWVPFVAAALKYDGVEILGDGAAVALWVPPGVSDTDAEDELAVDAMLPGVVGDRLPMLLRCFELFETTRPPEPHWYLSLLATRPDHRGRGAGMELVRSRLAKVDLRHEPAYLESTNPGNVKRYTHVGFMPHGNFTLPEGPTVDQMWRPAR